MGKYINEDSKGLGLPARNKTAHLIEDGALKIDTPLVWIEGLVCVVENAPFDAAGYAYDEDEMAEFKRIGDRKTTWMIYEHAKNIAK